MSSLSSPLPHKVEAFAGGCLPACLRMALAYFGVDLSQTLIASRIRHIPGAGTPARNVALVSVPGIRISYFTLGTLDQIRQSLTKNAVPIVLVRTSELPYWEEDTAHALIIARLNEDAIFVHDPAFSRRLFLYLLTISY